VAIALCSHARAGGAQDGLVTQMDAVKIADGKRAAAPRSRMASGPSLGRRKELKRRRPNCGFVRCRSIVHLVNVHYDLEAVISKLYIRMPKLAKAFIGFCVGQIVGNVRKPGATGPDF
jgi:hypothetical protein